jgi:hypothetical protein
MGTWIVKTNGEPNEEPIITIKSNPDGTVSLRMPTTEDVVVTARKVDEIRWALGAAIADAHAES